MQGKCLARPGVTALRTGADNPKREKDVFQAAVLAQALARKNDFLLTEAMENMDSRLKSRIRPGAKRALALFGNDAPEASSLLERLA